MDPLPTAGGPRPIAPELPRWALVCAVILLGWYMVAAWVAALPGVGIGNDDALYVFLSRSLLEGSYRDIFTPGAPLHVQYPPGLPVLLAGLTAVVGDRPEILLLLPLVLSATALALFFDAARRVVVPEVAVAALAIGTTNHLIITYGGRLKAEAPMWFFAMLALWCLAVPNPSRRRLAVAVASAIASAFMRTAGGAVIVAVLLHFMAERKWHWAAGLAVASAVTFGPWLAWSFFSPRQVLGRSYMGDMLEGTERRGQWTRVAHILGQVRVYLLGHLHAVMGFKQASGTLVDNLGWLVLLFGAGGAGVAALWRRWRVVPLVVVALLGVLFVWVWDDRRFLHPLVPLVGLLLALGGHAIGRRAGKMAGRLAVVAVLALLAPGTMLRTGALIKYGLICRQSAGGSGCYNAREQAYLTASVASRTLPDSAVVLTEREAAFSYHSGRLGVYSGEARQVKQDAVESFLRARGVTHVLVSRIARGEPLNLIERLAGVCGILEPVASYGEETAMFAMVPVGESPANDRACRELDAMLVAMRASWEARLRNPDVFQLRSGRSPDPGESDR